jgi:uncharacterized HhH-GPD family protein
MAEVHFPITSNAEDDQVLIESPLALMIGMLLDQQVPMSWAFRGPARLKERLDGRLDAGEIAAMGPDAVAALFSEKPALHRFPGSMGKRAYEVCRVVADEYDGDASRIWAGVDDGKEVLDRLLALPGFGGEKAKIFLAILGKRLGVQPKGWERAAAPFSDDVRRTVADADTPEHLVEVRAFKKLQKAAKKSKADAPA